MVTRLLLYVGIHIYTPNIDLIIMVELKKKNGELK